jgi:hypothetical protein
MSGARGNRRNTTTRVPPGMAYQLHPVSIVGDAALANAGIALGKLIPLLIIDTTSRPDITDLISAHTLQPPGDVTASWGKPLGDHADPDSLIHLFLQFARPVDSLVIIRFQRKHSGLVDQIVRTKLVYIQGGREGDRFINTPDAQRILVEIRAQEFEHTWEQIFRKSVIADFRNEGLTKKESQRAASELISSWRELGDIRMNPGELKFV